MWLVRAAAAAAAAEAGESTLWRNQSLLSFSECVLVRAG